MFSVQHHNTSIQKKAYYSTLGQATSNTRYLWIVCHGYGQLASLIIHKFSNIVNEEHFFIAPEGLSRFYWNEEKGQVGASWMTSKDRLHEITDYCNYLQDLLKQYLPQCHKETKVLAFGFSQGVATVWRWMIEKKPQLHTLIMWAGMTPEDLDYIKQKDYLSTVSLFAVYGTQDQYLTKERINFQLNLEKEQNLKIEHFTFDGRHVIDRPTLQKLLPYFLP